MGDIPEVQRADEVLRQIEERFRRLVEVMPVVVYVCDTSGIIQNYNRRAVELWGREPEPGASADLYCGSLRLYTVDGMLVPHHESKMAEMLRTGIEARDLEVVIERFQDITDRKRSNTSGKALSGDTGSSSFPPTSGSSALTSGDAG